MKLKIIYLFILIFIILVFKNYSLVLTSSLEAVHIWLNKVFPFLFIMLIISDILINLNFDGLFKTTTPFIIALSLLSGAPSNAYILANLVNLNKISDTEANIYLLFTYFANPLFLYSFFNILFTPEITLKLIIIHYLANFIIYFLVRKKLNSQPQENIQKPYFNLGKSINKSMSTLIMILGTITFFLILTNILTKTFSLNLYLSTLLKGFLEVTQGLNSLISLNILPKIKEIMAISFVSFGGLSIHFQVKCLLDEANLNYHYFLKGRIFQGLIAVGLTIIS